MNAVSPWWRQASSGGIVPFNFLFLFSWKDQRRFHIFLNQISAFLSKSHVENDNSKTKDNITYFKISAFLSKVSCRDMNAVSPWWRRAFSGGRARAASDRLLRPQLPGDPRFFSACCCCWGRPPEKLITELHIKSQCCGSGSGIRCLFDPGSGIGFFRISDPGY